MSINHNFWIIKKYLISLIYKFVQNMVIGSGKKFYT